MQNDDQTLIVIGLITAAFITTKREPVSLPPSIFDAENVPYKKVNEVIDSFADKQMFVITSRPKTVKSKSPYRFELTDEQKQHYKETIAELEQQRDMQMLAMYFGQICNIYDTVAGGYVGYEDPQLNRCYTYLTFRVEDILAKDGFEQWREAKPFIYDSLLGTYEDLDMAWEFMRPELYDYFNKLERHWLRNAPGNFKLSDEEQKLLDMTNEAIAEHRKLKTKANADFLKPNDPKPVQPKPKPELAGPFDYDDEHGKISYKNKTATLFIPTQLEGFLLYKVHRADGARITAADIANDYEAKHPELDKDITTKMLTNAKDRINKKLAAAFDITTAVQYERQSFWLHEKYCSQKSPYRTASSGN